MGIAHRPLAIIALALGTTPVAAQPVPLFPAQVSQANIDGLFGAATPHDETTDIGLPGITGTALLQSRTITAPSGSRAEGRTAYQYRVDLTNTTTLVDFSCVLNLSVEFGPVAKLPYAPGPILRDVYAITQGVAANQINFSSATQTGDVVTFTFARPICAGDAGTQGEGGASFAFGLASLDAPVRGVRVQVDALGLDDIPVKSFGPRR
jgi:hypothetical protein